ncbi:MAG: HAD family phosphatase [Myxococcota bacterium]|nr:HAD family phosphatase [Myxococcota bacterium]
MNAFLTDGSLLSLVDQFRPIKAVLFDLDGTLLDSEQLTDHLMSDYLIAAGKTPNPRELSRFHGVTWTEVVKRFYQIAPDFSGSISADILREKFDTHIVSESVRQIEKASEFVSEASQYFRCVVVSSSPRSTIMKALERLQILSCIEFFIGEEDTEKPKPAPDPYLHALTQLGLPATQALTFEDSDAGITSSMVAGMWTIGINRRNGEFSQELELEPHLTIDTYADLPAEFCNMRR